MKIQSIHFENFRLFDKLDINLHPSVNVFIGTNGAGKSAVLDGINLALQKIIYLLADEGNNLNFFQKNDIKIGEKECGLVAKIRFYSEDEVVEIFTDKKKINKVYAENLAGFLKPLREETPSNIPILSYYKWDRLSNIVNSRNNEIVNIKAEFGAYYKAFSDSNYMYQDFLSWFEIAENYENEIHYLSAVRSAISSFLSKLSGLEMGDLTIKRTFDAKDFGEARKDTANLILKKNGQELSFSQLSSGEKNILILIADIARKLVIANRIPINDDVLSGSGIVLIDEIDLHLHPSWQRNILSALHHTFPNIQFIVTTHSPQVLSNVAKESVFILNDGKLVAETPHTEGRDSNSILFELFGEEKRPILYRKKLEGFYDELEAENIEKAEQILAELTEKWGQYDTEIVRANLYLNDAKN